MTTIDHRNRPPVPEPRSWPGRLVASAARLATLFCLLAAAAFLAHYGLCRWDFFQITSTSIENCRLTSKEELLYRSGIDIHTNLLALDPKLVQDRLLENPWLEAVVIRKDWPNRLVITVTERKPEALVNSGNSLFYIDASGTAFAPANSGVVGLDYPVISGQVRAGADGASSASFEAALELLAAAGQGNSILPKQNISEIHLTGNGEMILILQDRPFPIFMGSCDDIRSKYYRLVKVLKNLYKSQEFSQVAYIVMDYMNKNVLVGKAESS